MRGTEKADIHAATLQPVAKNLRRRNHRVCTFREIAIANGKWKDVRPRADRTGLVNQDDVRRVRESREVRGGGRQADPDKTDGSVFEQA